MKLKVFVCVWFIAGVLILKVAHKTGDRHWAEQQGCEYLGRIFGTEDVVVLQCGQEVLLKRDKK